MGNVAAKTAPSDEEMKIIECFKVTRGKDVAEMIELFGLSLKINELPDRLIFPILDRFDQTRVHTMVTWDRKFYQTICNHIQFWRPRVIVLFRTDAVLAGKNRLQAVILTLSVFIPSQASSVPLGPREVKKMFHEEKFMVYIEGEESNESVLKLLRRRLRDLLSNVAVLRIIFDIRESPLPDCVQKSIARGFKKARTFFFCLGLEVDALSTDGMYEFLKSFPCHFVQYRVPLITANEMLVKKESMIFTADHPDMNHKDLQKFVKQMLMEFRTNQRTILVYIIQNFRPDLESLVNHDWQHYTCACNREMLLAGRELSSVRLIQNGRDLLIINGDIEAKELNLPRWRIGECH